MASAVLGNVKIRSAIVVDTQDSGVGVARTGGDDVFNPLNISRSKASTDSNDEVRQLRHFLNITNEGKLEY